MHLLDVVGCQWIYGFHLERINSFLLSSRDMHGKARFLRVKSSLDSSSYYPVISPSKMFVPPFQEDNLSNVSIVFYHTGVSGQLMQSTVNVHQFVHYALMH